MTPTDRGLLDAIAAHPADDALRLIYADWLDGQGQEERAEFIRVQCELTKMAARHHYECTSTVKRAMESAELRRRERELLCRNFDKWNPLPPDPHGRVWDMQNFDDDDPEPEARFRALFRRGFIASITLPCAAFLEHAAYIIEAVPMLEEVRLTDLRIYPVDGEPNGRVYIRHLPRGSTGYSTPLEIYDRVESSDVQPVRGRPSWKRFPSRMIAEMSISTAALSFAHEQLASRRNLIPS